MAQPAVTIASENRYRRILVAVAIFAEQVVLERIVAATHQPQVIPASLAGMGCAKKRYD